MVEQATEDFTDTQRSNIITGRNTIPPPDIDCHIDTELRIGGFCSIAGGLKIVSGQHPAVEHPEAISNFPFREWGWSEDYPPCLTKGWVEIGADVWIGQDVSIMQGVRVYPGAVIAAGSVVVKDVPPYSVVAGNPAMLKKTRYTEEQINTLLEIAWWDWPKAEIVKALPLMTDIDRFLDTYG